MKTSLKAENEWDIIPYLSGLSAPGAYRATLEGLSPDLGESSELEHSRQNYSHFCRVCFEQGLIVMCFDYGLESCHKLQHPERSCSPT